MNRNSRFSMGDSIPALALVLILMLGGGKAIGAQSGSGNGHATDDAASDEEDGDEPDYYEGADAPMGGTVNPESVGARKEDQADPESDSAEHPFWMAAKGDVYYFQHGNDNLAGQAEVELGKRLPLSIPMDAYAKLGLFRDGQDFYWDNRGELGLGARAQPLEAADLYFRVEALGGEYFRQELDSLARTPAGPWYELRTGLAFDDFWGHRSGRTDFEWFTFPFRIWGGIRSELTYSLVSRHERIRGDDGAYRYGIEAFQNLLFHADPSVGMAIVDGRAGNLSAFAALYVRAETRKDWWDNLAMGGPGLRFQPFRNLDLAVKTEYLWGRYLGKGRAREPNPYGTSIHGLRLQADFGYGLGI